MTQTEADVWTGSPACMVAAPGAGMRSGHVCLMTDWGHREKWTSGFALASPVLMPKQLEVPHQGRQDLGSPEFKLKRVLMASV